MEQAMRIKKLANTLGCSVPTVRRLIQKGLLPKGTRLPGSRVVIWFESDVSTYFSEIKNQIKPASLAHTKTWRSNKLKEI